MSYGVKVKVWGDWACFTRPEMKVERVSYDVMTPSAARAIIEAIYWKPSIRWIIRRIHVLKPIRFENIRRNEVGQKLSRDSMTRAMRDGHSPVEIFVDDSKTRQQRAAMVLREVSYIIEADFLPLSPDGQNEGKHLDIFNRRVEKGQCFYQPYLGTREFSAHFEPVVGDIPVSVHKGDRDLGWMFYDMDYLDNRTPMFFHATLRNGVLHVPPPDSSEVRK